MFRYVSRDIFPADHFPSYANGPTYLLSAQAVSSILSHAKEVQAFWLEDVLYTGVIAERAEIYR